MEPWESLYESDIFAVKSPETGKDYFISIMGRSHQVFALVAYEGAAGLAKFQALQNGDENLPPETMMCLSGRLLMSN